MLSSPQALSAQAIGKLLGAPVIGASELPLDNIATLLHYNERSVVFSNHRKTLEQRVGCLIGTAVDPMADACIVVSDPKKAMRELIEQLPLPKRRTAFCGIHPTAIVSASAQIGQEVSIGPYAVIEENCQIADHVVVGSHAHIMAHVTIGAHSQIGSGAILHPHISLGKSVVIGAHAVLGDEGFGYDWDERWVMFPQVGGLMIEDEVHIGPLSVIDRGALNNTVIGRGSKLDAKMMIGHGVRLGKNVMMAACAAVGGSTEIGDMTLAGGCVQIADHLSIAPHTRLAGGSAVAQSIRRAGDYASGLPLMPALQWRRWLRFVFRTIKP